MRRLFRPLMLLLLVLAVPIIPFLGLGPLIDDWAEAWVRNPPSPPTAAAVLFGLLATDIFLPVPSSVVSTVAGTQLGVVFGTLVSFLGMTVGAAIGFVVARVWGEAIAAWLVKPADMARMKELTQKFGPLVLLITRPVPILAEAGVLLLGIHRLTWQRFLPPVLLANLVLSLVYAGVGKHLNFLWAMVSAVVLPVVAACLLRWLWPEDGNTQIPKDPSTQEVQLPKDPNTQ